ncbi:hypothetical protein BGZ60DRAFT_370589 [Tricladium varicosporioides]|nr:hypothetical protein BGZ60DRAFT_370589 [Hymenoscyphus varicosporioides]
MTSRKKIATITRAAKRLECAVILKIGSPPGIMLCEGGEGESRGWEDIVRKLRYKDMRLMKREVISEKKLALLGLKDGEVKEIDDIKQYGKLLEQDAELYQWWRVAMGYAKDASGSDGEG